MSDSADAQSPIVDELILDELTLDDWHRARGARMVPFAGYSMPLHYAPGIVAEHGAVRERAGLFDVSHMGQVLVRPAGGTVAALALALERLIPADLAGLADGAQRYGLLLGEEGGIVDDLIAARRADGFLIVVNASRKAADLPVLAAGLAGHGTVTLIDDRALLALQGPAAEAILSDLVPDVAALAFMGHAAFETRFGHLWVSRSGYTGEDGFEISVPAASAEALADALVAAGAVPAGLGARDTLRLEAGLPLFGQDMDETVTPARAGLGWTIPKVRRTGGVRAGGFPGAQHVLDELAQGAPVTRVGLKPSGRAPLRAGAMLYAQESGGEPVGHVTSGAFGPSVGGPVAMARIARPLSAPGTPLWGELRGRREPAAVVPLPFVPHRFKRS